MLFFDDSILSQFDDIITVNDSAEKIVSTITGDNTAARKHEVSHPDASLTDREIEVLKLLAAGMATKEIAEELHISTNTVISHRKNLSVKTGIRSLSGLTIYAVVKKLYHTRQFHSLNPFFSASSILMMQEP